MTKFKVLKVKNGETIVSNEDYDDLVKYNWRMDKRGYIKRSIWKDGVGGAVYIHRHIMNAGDCSEVDHINQNKSDNRRENLRIVTRTQNQRNVTRSGKRKYGVNGVWIGNNVTRRNGKVYRYKIYRTQITVDKKVYANNFKNLEDAVLWRKKMEERFNFYEV